jgi:hypothetical protein
VRRVKFNPADKKGRPGKHRERDRHFHQPAQQGGNFAGLVDHEINQHLIEESQARGLTEKQVRALSKANREATADRPDAKPLSERNARILVRQARPATPAQT